MFRVASSPVAVVALVAVNLVPLAGVLWWGWNVQTLLILYWIENGIVGALAIPRMLRATGSLEVSTASGRIRAPAPMSAAVLVPFFVMHYGIFWVVHGVFVFTLPLFLGMSGVVDDAGRFPPLPGSIPGSFDPFAPADTDGGVRWGAVAFGALGLALSHGASFVLNYLGRGEFRRTSPGAQAVAPYGRVIVLHLTIILGVIVSSLLGSPIGALVVLIAVKTIVDLGLHLAGHRRLGSAVEVARTA